MFSSGFLIPSSYEDTEQVIAVSCAPMGFVSAVFNAGTARFMPIPFYWKRVFKLLNIFFPQTWGFQIIEYLGAVQAEVLVGLFTWAEITKFGI